MKRIVYLLLTTLILFSCSSSKKSYTITSLKGEYVPVTTATRADAKLETFVNSYKTELDKQMNEVIGYSAKDMSTGRPQSLLTNLTSDLMMKVDTKYTQGKSVDLAFMNVYGIRASIAEGEITVGDIFDAFPFDNALYVVQLKGKYLSEIFDSYAKMGGAGVSKNVKLRIKDNKILEATIDGKKVDEDKLYTIVTLDYLAEGNDGMEAMKQAKWNAETGITLRDYMLENVRSLREKGKKLDSDLDERIIIEK